MAETIAIMRARAAEFRRLADTFGNTGELRDRLTELARQADRIADEIARALADSTARSPVSESRSSP